MIFSAEEIEEIKIIARSVLQPDQSQSAKIWVNSQEAATALGISINRLRQARTSGQLRAGVDFRSANFVDASPNGLRWEYHLENCRQRLNNPADKRRIRR